MQEASFTTLIKTIFWIIAIYYIVRFLARLFLPVLAKKMVEKASEQFQQQYKNAQEEQESSIKKSNQPQQTQKVGEYIDYEEVE